MAIRLVASLLLLALCLGCSKAPEPVLNEAELSQAIKQLQQDQARVNARMKLVQRSHDSKEIRELRESLTDLDYSISATIMTVRATLNREKAEPIVSRQKVVE